MKTRKRGSRGTGVGREGRVLVGLAVLTLATAAPAAGATYYVQPRGNDGRGGTSPATAWRTVAKVNATKFAPGDRVLFARGGEWREQLVASSDGSAGRPVVYGAYGTGPRPRFWGSDVL